MVKLLRLTTEREDANFDIQFNEDIIIKPKSQLALKNLTLTMDEDKLNIDASNNEILFSTDADDASFVRGFVLPYEEYTYAEYRGLLHTLNIHCNKELVCADGINDFNTQIDFNVDENNNFKIEYFKSILFDYVPILSQRSFQIDTDFSADKIEISQGGTSTITQRHKLGFEDTFIKGAGVFRCRISDFVDNTSGNADNGFEIGLSDESPSNFFTNDNMTNAQRTYMIRFNRIGTAYTFLKTRAKDDTTAESTSSVNGTFGTTATADTNDILEIRLDEGDIVGNVYIHNGSSYVKNELFRDTLYGDLTFDVQRPNGLGSYHNLFPYIVLYGTGDEIKIKDIQHSLEEKNMMNYPQRTRQDLTLPRVIIPTIDNPIDVSIRTRFSNNYSKVGEFEFENIQISNYFGFEKVENTFTSNGYNPDGSFQNIVFNAENKFKPAIYSRNFVIEFQNINLTSYDSLYNGRKSILATIVDGNDISIDGQDVIAYEPSELTYIDIDNIAPLNIRNIKFKILDKNLNPIKIQGLGVCTIIIKEP